MLTCCNTFIGWVTLCFSSEEKKLNNSTALCGHAHLDNYLCCTACVYALVSQWWTSLVMKVVSEVALLSSETSDTVQQLNSSSSSCARYQHLSWLMVAQPFLAQPLTSSEVKGKRCLSRSKTGMHVKDEIALLKRIMLLEPLKIYELLPIDKC